MKINNKFHKRGKLLFVLKERSSYGVSYGLKNSCIFLAKVLEQYNIDCKVVEVKDTTFIDKEIHKFKPDHVIIEAIWAEPKRLSVIFDSNPNVKTWTVRIHSKTNFLAHEGIAIDYIRQYNELSKDYPNFSVAGNNCEFIKEFSYGTNLKLEYLPNMYLLPDREKLPPDKDPNVLDIGCFGSLRPMKAQLIQAFAAIKFAKMMNKTLHFHINGDRIEKGEGVSKNLIALFANTKNKLVSHDWRNHGDFLKLVRSMDLGMQVSINESFNIVCCDFISQNIPIVGSKEIKFLISPYQADYNDIDDIINKLEFAYKMRKTGFHTLSKVLLNKHNNSSIDIWLKFLEDC